MTTTTSVMPHKPSYRTSSHYGSMGRPSSAGRRKSAVELLQESKAFYVKSESVLDTRQELRNTDHLHVRSPTLEMSSSMQYRTLPGSGSGSVIPFFPLGTCPPYPHHHYEPYGHVTFKFQDVTQQQQLAQQQLRMAKEQKDFKTFALGFAEGRGALPLWSSSLNPPTKKQSDRRSIGSNTLGTSHRNRSSRSNARRTTLPAGVEFHRPKQLNNPTELSHDRERGSSSAVPPQHLPPAQPEPTLRAFLRFSTAAAGGGRQGPGMSLPTAKSLSQGADSQPPPIPPRSPKAASKPARPQDFPQMLPVQGVSSSDIPPPTAPPRRLNDLQQESNIRSKLRRLLHDGPGRLQSSEDVSLVPITLPSPILPPTPPPDVTLESPMSDSGPIISPPPAFSTPVTPMLDRQNSSASEKSLSQRAEPMSATMSMVSVSISSVNSSRNGRKSAPSLSDVSPPPYSRSSSSPMSPDDISGATATAAAGDEGDDDSSERASIAKRKLPSGGFHKKTLIPKSVTESTLCKMKDPHVPVSSTVPSATMATPSSSTSATTTTTTATMQSTDGTSSPARRPILRSKSDLSHRYIKSGNSMSLLGGGGFTLVHVDLGLPPPPPPHQNNSSHSNAFGSGSTEEMESRAGSTTRRHSSKGSLELERFFDKLGLDNVTPPTSASMAGDGNGSGSSSPVFFSSVSSVDSGPRRGGSIDSGDSPLGVKVGSRTVGGSGYTAPLTTSYSSSSIVLKHGEPSIVERNARVIKWLFNCRKATDKR